MATAAAADLSNAFDVVLHLNQTRSALAFFRDDILSKILDENKSTDDADSKGYRDWNPLEHFDSNLITESLKHANAYYKTAIDNLLTDPTVAIKSLGRVTHALEDFYAHSNWVNLFKNGYTNGQSILDEGYSYLKELQPLEPIGKTKILTLENKAASQATPWGAIQGDWTVTYEPTNTFGASGGDDNSKFTEYADRYVVRNTTDQGETVYGLMTGDISLDVLMASNVAGVATNVASGINEAADELKNFTKGFLDFTGASTKLSRLFGTIPDGSFTRYSRSVPLTDQAGNRYQGFDHGGDWSATKLGLVSQGLKTDINTPFAGKYVGPLNKDSVNIPDNQLAQNLATQQIKHEIIRFLCLINESHGQKGLEVFKTNFVREEKQSDFEEMIQSNFFDSSHLDHITNTTKDTIALVDDQILSPLLDSSSGLTNLESTPSHGDDNSHLPEKARPYEAQINAGDFLWSAGTSDVDGTRYPDAFLTVLANGTWQQTDISIFEFLKCP